MPTIVFSKAAIRTLSRMPANTAALIRGKIDQYAADPRSLGNNVIALKGEPGVMRLRGGDWRIIFAEASDVLAIIRIAPRGNVCD